jgi:hypothetical protein
MTSPDPLEWVPVLRWWCLATGWQLDRWEELLAQFGMLLQRNEKPPGALVWELRMEHHFALVAADNLRRALNRVQQTGFLKDLHRDIELLRHLPSTGTTTRTSSPTPPTRGRSTRPAPPSTTGIQVGRPSGSSTSTARRGPRSAPVSSPGSFGPPLTTSRPKAIKTWPALVRFLTPRPPAPWVKDDYDNWWPNPAGPVPDPE